ncbi:MAG: acyltransferase [Bacteroidota bacterium]
MTTTPYKRRNLGLDVVRTIAILLVLVEHSHLYFIFGNQPGVWGVEIFFVLSGYLIGQIIIRTFATGITYPKVREFWIRRWFRTLPMYFLVLVALDIFFDPGGGFRWRYYLFIQNFSDPFTFFPVSWSLTIEEWFYLLLPLLLLAILAGKSSKPRLTFTLVGVVVGMTVLRYVYVQQVDPKFDLGVRKFLPLRLDALMTGVLLAQVKLNYRSLFEKLARWPVFLLSLVCMAGIALFFYRNSFDRSLLDESFWGQVLIFPAMSLTFALAFPFLELSGRLNGLRDRHLLRYVITQISLMTYTIYLIHYEIFSRLVFAPQWTPRWAGEVGLSLVLTFALSVVLYRFVEKPATDLRERFSRKN